MDAAPARIAHYLDEIGAEAERRGEREWGVRLPSAKRGAVGALLTVRERTLTMRAFVLRGPDRNHEDVYRRLLHKNLRHPAGGSRSTTTATSTCSATPPSTGSTPTRSTACSARSARWWTRVYESMVRTGFDVPEGTEFGPPPGDAGLGASRLSIPVPKHSASR